MMGVPVTGDDEMDWAKIERALAAQGVKTDPLSAIQAARAHPEVGIRSLSILLLGLRGDRVALPVLREILDTTSEGTLREGAALALARLGDQTVGPILRELTEQAKTVEDRLFLAGQRARLFGDIEGYEHVVKAARSDAVHVRYVSARHLVAFALASPEVETSPTPPSALLRALGTDAAIAVRMAVLSELNLGRDRGLDITAYQDLVQSRAAKDPDPGVRELAKGLLLIWGISEGGTQP